MAGLIPEETISKVRENVNIVNVISQYVSLEKKGKIILVFVHSMKKKHLPLQSMKENNSSSALVVAKAATFLPS